MNTTIKTLIALSALALFAESANAAVVIENLTNTGNTSPIGPSGGGGKALNFVMGPGSDYTLSTVVLGLGSITGTPAFSVSVWSDDGTSAPIGSLLETLTNPTLTANSNNTFTSSGLTLSASTTYWVVVRNTGFGSSVGWLGQSGNFSITSDIGATQTARLFGDPATPGSWTGASTVLNRIQVNAVAVPEPGSLALIGLAGLGGAYWIACRGRRA